MVSGWMKDKRQGVLSEWVKDMLEGIMWMTVTVNGGDWAQTT